MSLNRKLKFSMRIAVMLCAAVIVAGLAIVLVVRSILLTSTEAALTAVAQQGAESINAKLTGQLKMMEAIATLGFITDPTVSNEEKIRQLVPEAEKEGFQRISLANAQGQAYTTDGSTLDVSDREYYQTAIAGKSNISTSIYSRLNGQMVFVFAVPVHSGGKVVSVLYATQDIDVLSSYTRNIRYTSAGNSFILDEHGYTLAHDNPVLVKKRDNDFENIIVNKDLAQLVEIEKRMIAGETGAGFYLYNGIVKYIGYAPVGSTGWSLGVAAPSSAIFSGMYYILMLIAAVFAGVLVLIIWWAMRYNRLEDRYASERATALNAVECAGIYIVRLSAPDWRILSCNGIFRQLFAHGESPENRRFLDYTRQTAWELARLLAAGAPFETNLYSGGEGSRYTRWHVTNFSAGTYDYEIMGVDITDRYEFQEAMERKNIELNAMMERYELVAEASRDVLVDINMASRETYVSGRFAEILEHNPNDYRMPGRNIWDLMHPDDMAAMLDQYREHLANRTPSFGGEYRVRAAGGEYKWMLLRAKAVTSPNGAVTRVVGTLTDISERKQHEEEVFRLAYYDQLTGLPNRTYLLTQMGKRLTGCQGAGGCTILLLDVDHFKYVNDSFGHAFGDALLKAITGRLIGLRDDCTVVFRCGGDEFLLYNEGRDMPDLLRAVRGLLDQPFELGGSRVHMTCSIGVSAGPRDGTAMDVLLQKADMALFNAKKAGLNTYVVYNSQMGSELAELAEMEKQMHIALANQEFTLHYQPLVSLANGYIIGFEALLRWNSSLYGSVPPGRFIPVAEEAGLIVQIGKWVIDRSFAFAARVQSSGVCVSCNVSALQLVQSGFVDEIVDAWNRHGLQPGSMAIEITESSLVQSFEEVCATLQKLQDMGLRVYLDDFGTGYSSLTYLKSLPIDTVKIDKSFIDDIGRDETERSIVSTIVTLAHEMGLTVVAEGVESRDQYEYLAGSRCNAMQGYFFSRPVEEDKAMAMIHDAVPVFGEEMPHAAAPVN